MPLALLGARKGTINAVCGRLVEDFAFELGRPPGGEVVTDDSAALLFATAAEGTLTRARDHLVLARNARPGAWLSALDVGENPQVVLPSTRDARSWLVASSTGRVSSCLRSRPNRLPSRPPATSF